MNIKLDFCIIENPLNKNKCPIIFVTKKGKKIIDETILGCDDYENAIFLIQNFGYIETDTFTFEFSQDPDYQVISTEKIKKVLEDNGMKYNIYFEKNMKNQFNNIQSNFLKRSDFINHYKILEVGQRITLFFHLFIECNYYNNKCYLNINGDFLTDKNTDNKNYVGIFKFDFVRINNSYNPNKIILKSCKTNGEIIKMMPMDYFGSFNLKTIENKAVVNKLFIYYLMEIKNNLPLNNRITIEIDNQNNYDEMIKISKKIKRKNNLILKRDYSLKHIKENFEKMIDVLREKMKDFANKDEFESAAIVKNDIIFIDNKLKEFLMINKTHIPYFYFLKKFHVK